jgi:GNAT superfamily N-acetyltransferase
MVSVETVTPKSIFIFKEARLRALQDSPTAFGATYARESQLTDAEWMERARQSDGVKRVMYMAVEDGVGDEKMVCGIAGALIEEAAFQVNEATRAQLISMWTAPGHRKKGVGRMLVEEVIAWARSRGVKVLTLMVTSVNPTATKFYEQLGFVRTGRTEPYPNDAAVIEYEMARAID